MGSAYGISDCVGWYIAGVGTFSDAGVTPAQPGQFVAQWNDQSGAANHLLQPAAANRPVLQACGHPAGVAFNSAAAASMNLPASIAFPSGAATVLLCTRGTAGGIVSFGSVGYGATDAGVLLALCTADGTSRTAGNFLPRWHPCVHGFVADTDVASLWINLNLSAAVDPVVVPTTGQGVLGQGVDPSTGFDGEVLELLIFDRALAAAEVQSTLAAMQVGSAISSGTNSDLLILVGDEQVAGDSAAAISFAAFPYWLDRSYSGAFASLETAATGQTCLLQQAALQMLLPTLNSQGFPSRVAVVACGLNDVLTDGCAAAEVIDRFTSLIQTIRTLGVVRVIAVVPLLQAGAAGVTALQQSAIDDYRQWQRAGAAGTVDAVVDWTADARLADAAVSPVFRSGAVLPTEIGSRVQAALINAAINTVLTTAPLPTVGSDYGVFYGASRSFTGSFGSFVRA